MAAAGITRGGPVVAEDARDLQSGPCGDAALRRLLASPRTDQGEPVERAQRFGDCFLMASMISLSSAA